jgi:FMN reductase
MSSLKIVGFAGSASRPSKTRTLVEQAVVAASETYGLEGAVLDLNDFGPSLGAAWRPSDLDAQASAALAKIVAADALVAASPVYKGSYAGLFKHVFDLIDPLALAGKPVLIAATGGGDRHALVVEHQLRPLCGFFAASTLATAVYASDRDFSERNLAFGPLRQRLEAAIAEFAPFLQHRAAGALAAQ